MSTHLNPRRVLLAGATGLVGGELLDALLRDETVCEVHALSRRALAVTHPKLQTHLVEMDNLPDLPRIDEAYLALGTTIAVAGSREAFRAVDFTANLAVARAAVKAGARRIGLVSAAAADPGSRLFYQRVKGEIEDALKALDLTTLVIARPSLLLDKRTHLMQPFRLGEWMAIPLARLLAPILPDTYQPVFARQVALALLRKVPTAQGVVSLPSHLIATLTP